MTHLEGRTSHDMRTKTGQGRKIKKNSHATGPSGIFPPESDNRLVRLVHDNSGCTLAHNPVLWASALHQPLTCACTSSRGHGLASLFDSPPLPSPTVGPPTLLLMRSDYFLRF